MTKQTIKKIVVAICFVFLVVVIYFISYEKNVFLGVFKRNSFKTFVGIEYLIRYFIFSLLFLAFVVGYSWLKLSERKITENVRELLTSSAVGFVLNTFLWLSVFLAFRKFGQTETGTNIFYFHFLSQLAFSFFYFVEFSYGKMDEFEISKVSVYLLLFCLIFFVPVSIILLISSKSIELFVISATLICGFFTGTLVVKTIFSYMIKFEKSSS